MTDDKSLPHSEVPASALQACARCRQPVAIGELVTVKGVAMCDLCADEVMDREADAMRASGALFYMQTPPPLRVE